MRSLDAPRGSFPALLAWSVLGLAAGTAWAEELSILDVQPRYSFSGRSISAERASPTPRPEPVRASVYVPPLPVPAYEPESEPEPAAPAGQGSGRFNGVKPAQGGVVTSRFGWRRIFGKRQFHKGIDLALPRGSPIRATGDGLVVFSGWASGYGNFVQVRHADGTVTCYGHCKTRLAQVGARVAAGQVIATVNSTGRSTGNHLHFEVRRGGRAVDPTQYFRL